MILRMFHRRWLLTTVLVIIAIAVMARLGVWQLDRLEQRRTFNARVRAQIEQPPLELTAEKMDANLGEMEYRKVRVAGEYDHRQEVALRNQALNGRWGVHLITPLRIEGSDQAVLVNRGWVPTEDFEYGDWAQYEEPGTVVVEGVFRASQSGPDFGPRRDPTPAPGEGPRNAWFFVNIPQISNQVSYSLLPVYIQQAPTSSWEGLPVRTQPELELTEGSHLGYAIQWFAFALILGIGYPFFIQRQEATGSPQPVPPREVWRG